MFITHQSIAAIEKQFIRQRVQRPRAITSGLTGQVVTTFSNLLPETGTVIGVAFRRAQDPADTYEDGIELSARGELNPFSLIVHRDDGSVEVWSSWTVMPARYCPSEPTLIDDVLSDTISVERFCALVGCDKPTAQKLIDDVLAQRNTA